MQPPITIRLSSREKRHQGPWKAAWAMPTTFRAASCPNFTRLALQPQTPR